MERQEVYKAIDTEREYQDVVRKIRSHDEVPDEDKSIADFVIFIEEKLSEAKANVYKLDSHSAMSSIRKIAGLCVAAGEAFGMADREGV